jgi:diguanylate cyclase (GGDEF)-like protein
VVVALDLDGLKRINDTEGHAAGDRAITGLASALAGSIRGSDSVYRLGGDEFVVLLPETTPDAVESLLRRIAAWAPSFSYGLASAPSDGADIARILDVADQRLIDGRRQRGHWSGSIPGHPDVPPA